MDYQQIKALYEENGLTDYKLRKTGDLLNIYRVDISETKGFQVLSEKHKSLYEKFIVNFYNHWGLERRVGFLPMSIKKAKFDNNKEYLHFTYKDGKEMTWLHVLDESSWY